MSTRRNAFSCQAHLSLASKTQTWTNDSRRRGCTERPLTQGNHHELLKAQASRRS